jgi:protein gp37
MADTAIEWTDAVWNPTTGCDRVSPGCANCYALTYAARLKAMGQPKYQRDGGKASGPGFGLTIHPSTLGEPLRWRKPRRVFVNSMSDLFHDDVPETFIERVFITMMQARRHTFQVLTKRPDRMAVVVPRIYESLNRQARDRVDPLPNVWLGVSIENRRFVDRANVLRATPAAVRFISAEPLLGPLVYDLRLDGTEWGPTGEWSDGYDGVSLDLTGIDWLIVGGESGPGRRRVDGEWIRDLLGACLDPLDDCDVCGGYGTLDALHGGPGHMAGPTIRCPARHTAFFFKQWGGIRPKSGGRTLDGRTWDEMPVSS